MPPRHRPAISTGFRGVQLRQSGHYAAEISCDGWRTWLQTYDTPELGAHAYDLVAWRFRKPRSELKFPDVTDVKEVEFLAPDVRFMSRKQEKEDCLVFEQRTTHESDAVAMARFAEANPHLMEAEREYFAGRNAEHKNMIKKEDEAGPSQVIKVESDEESNEIENDDVDWPSLYHSDDDE